MDKRTIIWLGLPFVMAAAVLFFLRSVKFAPSLTGTEKDLAAFSVGAVPAVSVRQPVTAVSLQSPIKIPAVQLTEKKEFPGQPLSQVAPPPNPLPGGSPDTYLYKRLEEDGDNQWYSRERGRYNELRKSCENRKEQGIITVQ